MHDAGIVKYTPSITNPPMQRKETGTEIYEGLPGHMPLFISSSLPYG